jgi:hypothetical protein
LEGREEGEGKGDIEDCNFAVMGGEEVDESEPDS